MYTILVISGIFICLGALITFIIVTFFAPEWIGISSKKVEDENKEDENQNSKPQKDFFSS